MTAWPTVALGDVASIERRTVNPADIPPSAPYVGLENIENGGKISDVRTAAEANISSAKFKFNRTQVLFGKLRPYLAKIARPTFDGVCSTDILPIQPSAVLDRAFLAHFLATPATIELATSRATGANLPRLNAKELVKFKLPLPSITEQKRIAEVLDRVDDLRAKRRQAIALLEELAESIFDDMFDADDKSGAFCTLGEVAEVVSGITKGRKVPDGVELKAVPYLAVANVQDKCLELSSVKTIDASASEVERYRLRKNDLLLTEGGDPDKLGRGTLWNNELPEAIHQNHIFRVRPCDDADINPIYLKWYVASKYGRRYFLRSAKQTTGIASINATQLKNFPLYVPSRHAQELFAARIAGVRDAQDRHLAHLARLNELFSSLQRRAFRGEL